ncbi:hypothetical protein [Agrobacterium sp. P15N1-A]|uniref:hypothetical protein n=1 Tax=Agrobacterium sp. P15N1-A TaxID=3342820 RepID=UPI0037D09CF6
MADGIRSYLDAFGFTIEEILKAKDEVAKRQRNLVHLSGDRFLRRGAPSAAADFQAILAQHWSSLFSDAGLALYITLQRDSPNLMADVNSVAANLFCDPVSFRDLTAWCLFFAARDAALATQMNCMAPRSEAHLSGGLLEALKLSCRQWSDVVDAALERRRTTLTLDFIDHSILGGEQATGGDFAIILDVDGRGLQPGAVAQPSDRKIIPLLFQAKRYVRPNADVSQKHHARGYQHALLGQNSCRSSYVFYENNTKDLDAKTISAPFPPLFKDVAKVHSPTTTAVLSESSDFATHLMTSLADEHVAARAQSPEDALRMVFDQAHPGQLCRLAIIASEADAYEQYLQILDTLDREDNPTIGLQT